MTDRDTASGARPASLDSETEVGAEAQLEFKTAADSEQERPLATDEFELYDLRVEVVAGEGEMVCNHREGDWFELRGENLTFPPGQSFPLYPLAALLPLLPAKQRETAAADWMTTDAEIACPDPLCGGRFRITRISKSRFRHGEVTRVPLPSLS